MCYTIILKRAEVSSDVSDPMEAMHKILYILYCICMYLWGIAVLEIDRLGYFKFAKPGLKKLSKINFGLTVIVKLNIYLV